MAERQVAACRSCGAPIRWAITRKQKNIPLDDDPSSAGSFLLQGEDEPKPLALKMSAEKAKEYTGDLYTCHFETCPDADSFRKKDKGRGRP